MAGSVGQGQHRGLEGVERSEGRSGFLAGDRCRRRNISGSGARSSGLPGSGSPGSGWGDADWEKLWGTNDFPRRVSLGSGFPVALLSGGDAEVSSSESTQGARIVHHDLLLSSGGFFAREVRVPKTSSESGGRSDADTADTAEVAPEKEVLVRKTRASLDRQTRQSGSPPVLDVAGLGGVEVRAEQRLVLTDSHLSATDADTLLAGVVDPAKITFRISAITGGKLQSLSSSGAWEDMGLATGAAYYAFTFADLQAGKIAFLAGDGLASGNGERIAFKVQAVDDDNNESDSDDATPGDQAADGSVGVDRAEVAVTAGVDVRINEDGVLSPDEATLTVWKQSATTHNGTLHVIVKLFDMQNGDVLSLATGYDASKVTPVWDLDKGELSLEIASGATEAEIRTALGTLSLATEPSGSASVRQVWVFPTLSGVDSFDYHVDETAGLVRYYFYDNIVKTITPAKEAAAERILFGKKGYLGVYTSDAEKDVYLDLAQPNTIIHLAISDSLEEDKWLVTAGPRKGLLFWDEGTSKYGPGASGSGWNAQGDFWFYKAWWWKEPDGGTGENYASIDTSQAGPEPGDISDGSRSSVSHHDFWLSDGEVFMRPVDVGESPPNPILKVDFSKLRVDSKQLVVLSEKHISVYDPDTPNASDISFRVSGVSGGTLQEYVSSSWDAMGKAEVGGVPQDYFAFTLADVRDGKVAFLAGDGVATVDGGEGKKIVFRIQAVDKDNNFSDSDPSTGNVADPVDGEISIVLSAEVIAGTPGRLNADESLTPDVATLRAWKQEATTRGGALRVIVKLSGHQAADDALSLATGYDASKVTPGGWNAATGELPLEIASGATEADIQAALKLLELRAEVSFSSSTRRVWVFPTLPGASDFAYRVDETAGLVRYYLFDNTNRSFVEASTVASESSLFGKQGYLGAFTSDTEKDIYKALLPTTGTWIRLALTDAATEGKWLITAGPREGLLFWDHTGKQYGPGAAGSDFSVQTDFWKSGQPNSVNAEDYAMMYKGAVSDYVDDAQTKSMIHHDLWLAEGEIFARPVNVRVSGTNPLLKVDFSGFRATAQRPLILTEDQILLNDPDTRDPLDDAKVDASKIELRITNISDGTVQKRASASDPWVEMTKAVVGGLPKDYYAFTLVQLQDGLIALFPNTGVSTLTFDIQAADDDSHLSDSDPSDDDPDPISASVSVIALKTLAAASEVLINGDGILTPRDDTLNAWLVADDTLQIFVKLQGGKSGIVTPGAEVVQERLSVGEHSVPDSKITISWDARNNRLSLQGSSSATRANFKAVLGTLKLQTVHSIQASYRTISVLPNVPGDVTEKEFYVREVKVGASPKEPFLSVRGFGKVLTTAEWNLVLDESHMSVYDMDTVLQDGSIDPAKIMFRITNLVGGTLQRRSSDISDVWTNIDFTRGTQYREFSLADLRSGLISLKALLDVSSVSFEVQVADDGIPNDPTSSPNLSDSDPNIDGAQPANVTISVVEVKTVTAGEKTLINDDKALTADDTTLGMWLTNATLHSGTLQVVVKLFEEQSGDVLSLGAGYDTNKITHQWNQATGELSLRLAAGTTELDIQTALELLELETSRASSASARKVWVFPTLSLVDNTGVSRFHYRVDEEASLVRYYFYDGTARSFSAASTEASRRIVFDKKGYLGVHTSEAEKDIYKALRQHDIHLAMSDVATEGKWVITAGPRKDQVFWDHTANPKEYGPGARGSGWTARNAFWHGADPNNWGSDGEAYAKMRPDGLAEDDDDRSRASISHHDLWLSTGEIFARLLEVQKSPPNPFLEVDFSKFQTTSQRPLILTEAHISVDDVDTRDSADDTKVAASKIELRVTQIVGGTLRSRLASDPDTWAEILFTIGTQYRKFTLAQLQSGLVAFFPNAGASTLTFEIQAADDGDGTPGSTPHLSDSDPDTVGTQPASVSVSVVGLKEIEAGQKGALNDDGDLLTPDTGTLRAWLTADGTLEILVELQGGKSGIVVLEDGAVEESLSLSGSVSNITATWDTVNDRLSLQGSVSATVGHFEAALRALQLQTVRFKEDSYRKISVRPNVAEDVPKKEFYAREVKVGVSPQNPLLGVRGFARVLATAERPLVLTESHLLVDDVDTVLSNGDIDASRITFRVSDVVGGTLQERTSASADWVGMTEEALNGSPLGYYAFTLAELQGGLVAFSPDADASTLTFKVQAADDGDPDVSSSPPHLSDSDPNDNQNDADPASVSISVVVLKEIEAGQKGALNDDSPRGGLTPDTNTLQAWLDADNTLEIFVELQGGKSGIVVLEEGVVEEVLSLSAGAPNITATWDAVNDRLSLQGRCSLLRLVISRRLWVHCNCRRFGSKRTAIGRYRSDPILLGMFPRKTFMYAK